LRVQRIEEQLDGWLLSLANSLRACGSLGDAMASSVAIVQAPIQEEVDLVLKECRLGSPLDQSLEAMARRVDSRVVAGALLALRVARNTGGDLPVMLERASSTLREVARLEGVVRAKTAEGKAQAVMVSAIPVPLVALVHFIAPDFFAPLTTLAGKLVVAVAALLWAVSVWVAVRIAAVDV
jgi:tight adherence protein B